MDQVPEVQDRLEVTDKVDQGAQAAARWAEEAAQEVNRLEVTDKVDQAQAQAAAHSELVEAVVLEALIPAVPELNLTSIAIALELAMMVNK